MPNDPAFATLTRELLELRDASSYWYDAYNQEVRKTARGNQWLGWITVILGGLTTVSAIPDLKEIPFVTLFGALFTTLTAAVDKRMTESREKRVPALSAAAQDYAAVFSRLQSLYVSWNIAATKGGWDASAAADAIDPLRTRVQELGSVHSALGLERSPAMQRPRSGTGLEAAGDRRGNVLPGSGYPIVQGRGYRIIDDERKPMFAVQMPQRHDPPVGTNPPAQ